MKKTRKAFTLVEVILVLALIGVISTVSYSIFFTGQKSFETGIDKGLSQEDDRILREYLTNELRSITEIYTSETILREEIEQYSSLEIIKNGDRKYLIKKRYANENNVKLEEQKIPVNFNELDININSGKVVVKFYPLNYSDFYEFTIGLENNQEMDIGEVLNSRNIALKKIYYVYPKDIKQTSTK